MENYLRKRIKPETIGSASNVLSEFAPKTSLESFSVNPALARKNVLLERKLANSPLPETATPDAYSQYWGTPVVGKMPLDQFVRVAGMAGHAFAPDEPMGRLGAGLYQMGTEAAHERMRREYEGPNELLRRQLVRAQLRRANAETDKLENAVPTEWESFYNSALKAGIPETEIAGAFEATKRAPVKPTYKYIETGDGRTAVMADGQFLGVLPFGKSANDVSRVIYTKAGNAMLIGKDGKPLSIINDVESPWGSKATGGRGFKPETFINPAGRMLKFSDGVFSIMDAETNEWRSATADEVQGAKKIGTEEPKGKPKYGYTKTKDSIKIFADGKLIDSVPITPDNKDSKFSYIKTGRVLRVFKDGIPFNQYTIPPDPQPSTEFERTYANYEAVFKENADNIPPEWKTATGGKLSKWEFKKKMEPISQIFMTEQGPISISRSGEVGDIDAPSITKVPAPMTEAEKILKEAIEKRKQNEGTSFWDKIVGRNTNPSAQSTVSTPSSISTAPSPPAGFIDSGKTSGGKKVYVNKEGTKAWIQP